MRYLYWNYNFHNNNIFLFEEKEREVKRINKFIKRENRI